MTFEKILPEIKLGKKAVRTNWEGTELFVIKIDAGTFDGDNLNPYFLIKTADEAYSMWTPNVCDVLATDWVIVE
jgi:Protein of unknown function (DUF2829).